MQTALTTTQQPTALAAALGFDTSILAGSVSESTQRMYMRDFTAYLQWAGSAEAALQPTTLAQHTPLHRLPHCVSPAAARRRYFRSRLPLRSLRGKLALYLHHPAVKRFQLP